MILKRLKEVGEKFHHHGFRGILKALGRRAHGRIFQTPWNFTLIPSLLIKLASGQEQLVILQIGANAGNTESDPLCKFLLQPPKTLRATVKAVLIEPVPELFQQLSRNYAHIPGVLLEKLAIAESTDPRMFYGLRAGIDLAAQGLPPWSYQLGSFFPHQTEPYLVMRPFDPDLKAFVEKNIVKTEVPCEPLSRLCARHDLQRVDLLQIDTEGYDYRVLKTLDFSKVLPLYINYERIHLKGEESACRRFLGAKGYALMDHGQDTLATWRGKISFTAKLKEWAYCGWLDWIWSTSR